ncbi:toxin [Escherichia coli]|nr:toxin [Escherichia coli]PCQ80057.1 toxin [Escherichia coli]
MVQRNIPFILAPVIHGVRDRGTFLRTDIISRPVIFIHKYPVTSQCDMAVIRLDVTVKRGIT